MELTTMATNDEQIGRYQLIEVLGEGSLSVVYKAFDPTSKRKLAVKVLCEEQAANRVNRSLFLAEAKAVEKLTHANIVTVYDVGEDNNRPYIAMEYVQDETLEEVINSSEKLSTRDIITIGIQLAEALEYTHKKGVIHRDIKPGNIFISEDRRLIRITDFGIAHIQHLYIERHTNLESVPGTPHYMSPEQIEGLDVDGRTDLFSIGILLYQLITGEKPFQAHTLSALLTQIVKSKPAKLKEKVPDIPQDLQKIVEKLLNKERKQRYQNGAELADELQIALAALEKREKRARKKRNRERNKKRSRNGNRIFPLHYKWTGIMAMFLVPTLLIAGLFIYERQVDSMSKLSLEFGGKLARFISIESAEALLAQDWVAIEMLAKDARKDHDASYLDIIDINGVSRGGEAQGTAALGYSTTIQQIPASTAKDIRISEKSKAGKSIFEFETPIRFQEREIGRVRLGLPKTPLKAAADQTLTSLLLLLPVIMIIVLGVVWLLTSRMRGSLIKLTEGLNRISHKRYDIRLDETHKGELGQLVKKYNSMAEALELGEHETETETETPLGAIEIPLTNLEASLDEPRIDELPDEAALYERLIEQQEEESSDEFDPDKNWIKPALLEEPGSGISEPEVAVEKSGEGADDKHDMSQLEETDKSASR